MLKVHNLKGDTAESRSSAMFLLKWKKGILRHFGAERKRKNDVVKMLSGILPFDEEKS